MVDRLQQGATLSTPHGRRPLTWNALARLQAGYYLVTGLWPLLHLQSFLTVTGPKTDVWLVKTLGVLISVIGAVLGMAGVQQSVTRGFCQN